MPYFFTLTGGRRNRNRNRRPVDTGDQEYPPYVPRDPFSRWLYNNIDGEIFETLLPLWALG